LQNNYGTFLISLDFELLWGIRDFADQERAGHILATREVVPRLLNLFKEFEVHATWATVGFLFFETRGELLDSLPEKKPGYVNQSLSPYLKLKNEIGPDEQSDALHFAPTLIRQILQTPHQELATHTFSHYYCLEEGQTTDDFEDDLRAALRAGKKYDCEIKSVVFPRNQYSDPYLDVCARNGIQAYRGTEDLWFRQSSNRQMHRHWSRRIMRIADAYMNISGANIYPLPDKARFPINLPASRYLRTSPKGLGMFEPLRLKRITSAMTEAAKTGQIFHLWWHPEDFSENMELNFKILDGVLSHFVKLRNLYKMQSLAMHELVQQIIDR